MACLPCLTLSIVCGTSLQLLLCRSLFALPPLSGEETEIAPSELGHAQAQAQAQVQLLEELELERLGKAPPLQPSKRTCSLRLQHPHLHQQQQQQACPVGGQQSDLRPAQSCHRRLTGRISNGFCTPVPGNVHVEALRFGSTLVDRRHHGL